MRFIFALLLVFSSQIHASCELEASGWSLALVNFLRDALKSEIVQDAEVRPLAEGTSWSNPISTRSRDIHNISLRKGVQRALKNIKTAERPAARAQIQKMLDERARQLSDLQEAKVQTKSVLQPRIVADYFSKLGQIRHRTPSKIGWVDGRPVYIGFFLPDDALIKGNNLGSILIFDPLNPDPEKTHAELAPETTSKFHPMFFEMGDKSLLAILGTPLAFNLSDQIQIDLDHLLGKKPGKHRFSSSSLGFASSDLPGEKYLAVWSGHGGTVYKLLNSKFVPIANTPRLGEAEFVRLGAREFLIANDSRKIYIRELKPGSPEIVLTRSDNVSWDQVAIYEDQDRLYAVYRETNSDRKWNVVRVDLETKAESKFPQFKEHLNAWKIVSIRGVPHLCYLRASELAVMNLRTMQAPAHYASLSVDAGFFAIGGVPYALLGSNIIDLEENRIVLTLPLDERIRDVSETFMYKGDQYVFVAPYRKPPLLLRLTAEVQE